MRELVSFLLYPVTLFTGVGLGIVLIQQGFSPALTASGLFLGIVVLLLVLQKAMPHREDWIVDPWEFGTDLLHVVFSTTLPTEFVRAAVLGLGVWIGGWVSAEVGIGLWPDELPVVLQLGLALVVGEFGYYWAHRLSHEHELLWRIHAMHHSSKRLYLLSSSRTHPLGVTLNYSCMVLPLVLLGIPMEVLALTTLFTGINGALQHCNIRMYTHWANGVLSTADIHRWHHSDILDEGNSNYGSNLVIYDRLFGTWLRPETDTSPDQVGLHDLESFPTDFLGHLASPFTWGRWRSPDA